MNFLQSPILYFLPLALLPVIIHLINQHRHRTVKWAAMMFLLDAKKMTKGMARLRQILILAMRVLAIAALILAAARPLASGWIALTAGGKAETVLVLLDRSASMEQQNLETGKSKRSTALEKLADVLEKTAQGSRIVLIDSAGLEPTELSQPKDLIDLPSAAPTDTSANIPELLQAALDYIASDRSGPVDVWLASDLRASDWQPAAGQWETLRASFAELEGVSFYLLNYPDAQSENFAVSVPQLTRRRGAEGLELVLDLLIRRQSPSSQDSVTLPVEFTVNGARTVEEFTLNGSELRLQGHIIDLGRSEPAGWGRVDLPADENLRDNTFFFVFDEAPVLKTVIVSDDSQCAGAIQAAASAQVDATRKYSAEILSTSRSAETPWEETALLFWHKALPATGSPEAALLEQFVASGKSLVLLPPDKSLSGEPRGLFDFRWKPARGEAGSGPFEIGWWRTDSGLLRNTQNGNPLPLGSTRIFRVREFIGEIQPFLKLQDGRPVIAKHVNPHPGSLYIWATLPRSSHSSLASDGVAFFAMIHRALQKGGNYLAKAQLREAGPAALPEPVSQWKKVSGRKDEATANRSPDLAGAWRGEEGWAALNRPSGEDDFRIITEDSLADLFSGLDYRVIRDNVDNRSSLAAEIWRAFLVAMALALLLESILCLPPRPEPKPVPAI